MDVILTVCRRVVVDRLIEDGVGTIVDVTQVRHTVSVVFTV